MLFGLSRRAFIAAGLAAAATVFSGCGGDTATTTTTAPGGAPAKVEAAPIKEHAPDAALKLAFVTNNSSTFWTIARAGTEKAKTEVPNITVDFVIPGEQQAATQKREVEDLLVKGVDGIAISPIDPANQTQFLDSVANKAMLVTQDSDAPQSQRAVYIGTDNKAAGVQAGELLKKVLPDGGDIMMFVGSLDAQNAKDRLAGIKQTIEGTKIHIIDTRTDDGDSAKAKANAQDTLVKYPNIAGVVGLYSYDGPAILSAVKDANKIGKLKIVCFDEDPDTLAGVKAGQIEGTIVQQPYEFGRQSIELMAKVLRGDKTMIPESRQIFIPTRVIDKDSVDDFWAKLKTYTAQ